MSRGRKKAVTRAACWLFAAAFAASVIANGICLCNMDGAQSGDGGSYIVSLDVCGSGPASVAVQGMDVLAVTGVPAGPYVHSISVIPPAPEPAAASAEPGEMDKPPEA